MNLFPTLTWKELVDERFIIAGGPESVRQQMEELIKSLHVGHIFGLFHKGNMPDWKTRHSSRLFAEKVMPKLRDVWPEWKHDDRWWPKPMQDRVHPEEAAGKDRIWPEHRAAAPQPGHAHHGHGADAHHPRGPREEVR